MESEKSNIIGRGFYFNFVIFYSFISVPIALLRVFFNINFVLPSLLLTFVLKIFFLVVNRNKIKTPLIIMVLLILISISLIIGLISHDFSRRIITDFLKPILFLLIAGVFIGVSDDDREYFKNRIKKAAIPFWLYSALASLLTFLLLRITNRGNIGFLPPIEIPFCLSMFSLNYVGIVGSFLIIFLSGKRAVLFAFVFIFIVRLLTPSAKTFLTIVIIVPLLITSFIFFSGDLSNSVAYRKYEYTLRGFTSFFEDDRADWNKLDKYTGARISEARSALKDVKDLDFIFGKGLGYTYTYQVDGVVLDSNYGNIHFTPLSLLVYYGGIYTVFFYLLFFIALFKSFIKQKKDELIGVLFYLVFFIFMTSFFSYAIFNSPLWPMVLGLVFSYSKKKEKIGGEKTFN